MASTRSRSPRGTRGAVSRTCFSRLCQSRHAIITIRFKKFISRMEQPWIPRDPGGSATGIGSEVLGPELAQDLPRTPAQRLVVQGPRPNAAEERSVPEVSGNQENKQGEAMNDSIGYDEYGLWYLSPSGKWLPSITSVLSGYFKRGNRTLEEKVGAEAADRISSESRDRGTAMHAAIESFLNGTLSAPNPLADKIKRILSLRDGA